MATLLTVAAGGHTRRCDATCYDAQGDRCRCVCGGVNHGVGYHAAATNTAAMADEWLAREGVRLADIQLVLPWDQQLPLPGTSGMDTP